MSHGDPLQALRRYRRDYLKLRSVLHDRATSLPAYPLQLDRIRGLLDTRRRIGVLHIGVDNLETIESLYGWQVLDGILARASHLLRGAVANELPAGTLLSVDRVAGDQFILFVPDKPGGEAVDGEFLTRVGTGLCAALATAFDVEEFAGLNPPLGFRSGYSTLSIDPFYRFERRVYTAVAEARSREARRAGRRRRSHGEELRRIIEGSAVRMLFQPVVELQSRRVLGYEALARGPENSAFEMPGAMFNLSTEVGASADLDRVCRQAAFRESAAVGGGGNLFVNIWPGSLDDPEWGNGAAESIGEREGWRVVLEVSERGVGPDPHKFVRSLTKLKQMGYPIALDDVGTGYGSLATLQRVEPDYLKVDSSVVRDIHESLIKQEVFSSVVQIAARIGSEVVAEGVESEEELRALKDVGARYGQGFLFAGPAPAADVDTGGAQAGAP
jgi:EAL domain-containing protein (putative c-di-GMP-specific phosphodiesterase class I)